MQEANSHKCLWLLNSNFGWSCKGKKELLSTYII